ncbi:dienelactone hydrolase family protein [Actinosynnema sp. NPDC002837]
MIHDVVLFHSVLGRRPSVLQWAEDLRAAGHRVHTPDLFDGETYDDIDDGMRKVEALGAGLRERTLAAVAGLPPGIVVAGFSMGAAVAVDVATLVPGVRAAVLMNSVPVPDGPWPDGVPAQLHFTEGDPWVGPTDLERFRAAAERAGAALDVHVYPGGKHMFGDAAYPEYEPELAELMRVRVLDFLARIGE